MPMTTTLTKLVQQKDGIINMQNEEDIDLDNIDFDDDTVWFLTLKGWLHLKLPKITGNFIDHNQLDTLITELREFAIESGMRNAPEGFVLQQNDCPALILKEDGSCDFAIMTPQ